MSILLRLYTVYLDIAYFNSSAEIQLSQYVINYSKLKMENTRDYLLHCLCIIILCAAVGAAATRELYVKPSSTAACPSSTCYTLDHILQNPSQYLISNLTIFFFADTYEISTEGQVVVTNVSNIAFVGSVRKAQLHSKIRCKKHFGLAFMKGTNVNVSHLSIERCGVNLIIFFADAYEISTEGQVVVTNVSNIAFVGSVRKGQLHSKICYTKHFGLAFMKGTNVNVSHLSIERCGVNLTGAVLQELKNYWSPIDVIIATLTFVETKSLSISGVSVITPNGYGLWTTIYPQVILTQEKLNLCNDIC